VYLLESKIRVNDYVAFCENFDQVARFAGLSPYDRHYMWREQTADEDFHEWPVPISHFLFDPYYVGTDVNMRPVVAEFLHDFWDPRLAYELFVFIAGIGAGKSFSASLSLMYTLYQLSCMKQPQKYINGFPGVSLSGDAEIVLMNASAAGAAQASKIVFGEAYEKIINAPYFKQHFEPYSGKASELLFPNRIRFTPGTSQWRSALGWNLFGFIVDEAALGVVSEAADYVREMFLAYNQRRRSRFGSLGFGGLFTSPGSEYGYVELLAAEDEWDQKILVRRTTTWEAKDELKPGEKVFLLDRDPDRVRIIETALTLIDVTPEGGIAQRDNGEIVRFKSRPVEETLADSPAQTLVAG
jgi:hypothetical protein